MTTTFMRAIDALSASAIASGDLQPIVTEQAELVDDGLRFIVRWVSSLASKDAASAAVPGGPRDPTFNPFLSPAPALTLGPLGERHIAVLNKFPVSERHLVIVTREFEEQLSPLDPQDFTALALILTESGGLGFYNGGAAGGASQRHKHVQWLPEAPANASLRMFLSGLPDSAQELSTATHRKLALKHCFVRIDCSRGTCAKRAAESMHEAFELACRQLDLRPDGEGLLPPSNMLVSDGWLLLVPRSREHFEGISINALSYGGTFYVRDVERIEAIRKAGPLKVLAEVGC